MKDLKFKSEVEKLRRNAEKILKKATDKPGYAISEVNTIKLIHELKIHQIELELQNEEFRLAKLTAEDAVDKYTQLYDFAPSGYFTLTREGLIKDLNLSGSQMLEKDRSNARNNLFGFFVSDETRPVFNRFLENIFSGNSKESCELTLITIGNSPKHFILSGILNEDGGLCNVTMVDITLLKHAEQAYLELNATLENHVKERTAELLKSNALLRRTEEKYRTVADFTHDWEYWTDPDGNFLYCSPSCKRITGYHSTSFMQNPNLIVEIVHPDDLNTFQSHQQREASALDTNQEIQFRIVRPDGTTGWIGHVCQPVYDKSALFTGIRGSNRDITERKNMELLLTISQQKYKLLSENITDGIFICNNGTFEYTNEAMNRIFGYEKEELNGTNISLLVLHEYQEEIVNILKTDTPFTHIQGIELQCLKRDLTTIIVELIFNYIAHENTIYGVVHDITEKKLVQKNIVKAIVETEEKERLNFSKELHDGLGPLLSLIKLYIQWSQRPNSNISPPEIMQKAEKLIDEALAALKEISNKLSPHILLHYGLTSAIQDFVDKLNVTSVLRTTFQTNTHERYDAAIEAALYRAVIECINNTIKHAGASTIHVMLNDSGGQLQLFYKDDGIGFDLTETHGMQKGLGLFNLQNRIQTIGGKTTISSHPGQGVFYQIVVNI